MDFSLSLDLLELERSVYEFARRALVPILDSGGPHARRLAWLACAEFGIQGLPVAERYGGSQETALACAVALDALARVCDDGSLLFSLAAHLAGPMLALERLGTDAQRQMYAPALAAGTSIGGAPIPAWSADSAQRPQLSYAAAADEYVLEGGVSLVTNSAIADLFLVFAEAAEPSPRARGASRASSAFLVPRESRGLTVGVGKATMGLTGAPVAQLAFDSCHLPASALLGSELGGHQVFATVLAHHFITATSCHVGRMERLRDQSAGYARERRQFGKPIGHFQALAHKIADMDLAVELSRLVVRKAAWLADQGQDPLRVAAMAKLFVSQSYIATSRDAVQIHGGLGIMAESHLDRDLRDALGSHVYLGGADTPRDIIAHLLLALTERDEPPWMP